MRIVPVANDADYKRLYAVFKARYPQIDDSGKDISRACFFCYDPEIYINDNAAALTVDLSEKAAKKVYKNIDRARNDYSVASKACNIIRHAQVGERHNCILKASRLLGGYVAGGHITYNEAERILLQEADLVNEDWRDNLQSVKDGLANGMQSPLSKKELDKQLEAETNVLKYGKIYYTVNDKADDIINLYNNGQQKGYGIGLDIVDEHYTCKMGTTTYVYAAPYAGKTEFWCWILMQLSKKHGLNHALFSPETGNAEEIMAQLVQAYAKKDFYDTYGKQMNKTELLDAMDFVAKHFIIIDPSHHVISQKEFFCYVDEIERVYNTKVHTATIDPFNELSHDLKPFQGRQDMYLEATLSEFREAARTSNRHNCILTHVQDQQIMVADGIRYYPMPTYREIAGGQAWSRKGMSMISLWRPKQGLCDEHGMPYPSNALVVEVQKSKPKGVGKTGRFTLLFDVNRHTFTDEHGNEPKAEISSNQEKYNPSIDEDTADQEVPF